MNNENNNNGKQCFSENDHRRIGKELDLFSFSEYVWVWAGFMASKRCNYPK